MVSVRVFHDVAGATWRVWESDSAPLGSGVRGACLIFAHDFARRELSPVPDDWTEAPTTLLREWLVKATPTR